MSPLDQKSNYWSRLDSLADTEEFRAFVKRTFPSAAADMDSAPSRRSFLRLMGASLALAGLAGCRWPKERIVPFARRPDGRIPGEPEQYATVMELAGAALGLLVTSYDGRPVKIEGNPNHPDSLGAAGAFAQAAVLELYDPDRRAALFERRGREEFPRDWPAFGQFARAHFGDLRRRQGAGLRILAEQSSSPSLEALKNEFLAAFPQAGWVEYDGWSHDAEREGLALAFGRPLRAIYDFAAADVVASLDADFLFDHPAALRHARQFAGRRRAEHAVMNRLWVAECAPSITGAAADHHQPMHPDAVQTLAAWLAAELLVHRGLGASWLGGDLRGAFDGALTVPGRPAIADRMADDLARHPGRALVLAGPRQPAAVHALAHLLNTALGAVGTTVRYAEDASRRPAHAAALAQLVAEMKSGAVDTLVVLGGNPVYNAPRDLDFAVALGKVRTSIHLGLHNDETGRGCTWRLPRAHFLETWGDGRAWDGSLSVAQPLIEPLFDGKSPIEVIALLLGDEQASGHQIVRRTFAALVGGDENAWRTALDEGVVAGSAFAAVTPSVDAAGLTTRIEIPAAGWADPQYNRMAAVFAPGASVYDGRFANNGWLQETPDPLTKLVWDNAALIGPATAKALGVTDGDIVRLEVGGRALEIPALVTPGVAPATVALSLGYGRTAAGGVGDGVGFDANILRTTSSLGVVRSLRVSATGERHALATTQPRWAIDALGQAETERRARQFARGMLLAEFEAGAVAEPPLKLFSLWKEHRYDKKAWGMSIDLAACIGCNACAVACQAENNIPVVGKEQVARGREMSWIRVDRYFVGDADAPDVRFQPVACVHCENAPCEQVCPVGATVHSEEGLNQMVYNRCIGTRYCANNCPFKVRRFNFFNYHKNLSELQMMQHNPEVTVRSRGVMEKCTYCVQRIEAARIRAKAENRPLADGEVVPACAQACPTQAIVFGDLNEGDSRVRALAENRRSYTLLAELNILPRTSYMARLRNPAAGAGGGEAPHS